MKSESARGKLRGYGRHLIDDDDIRAVVDVLRGDWLTTGPMTDAFESEVRRKLGAVEAVSCSSGTAGLHLAYLALGISEGDVVVVPAVTFVATANAARWCGAEVVFADVDPNSALLGPRQLDEAITRARKQLPSHRVRLAVPVHMAGQACDMPGLGAIAAKHDVTLIEDACHAMGSIGGESRGRYPIGSCAYSSATVFSGHPVKNFTMAEGGVVTTSDSKFAGRMRLFRGHGVGRDPAAFQDAEAAFDDAGKANPWYYEMIELGLNYRASDLHCALGLSQLQKLELFVEKRRALLGRYRARSAEYAPALSFIKQVPGSAGWHLAVALIDFAGLGRSRGDVARALAGREIGTQVHYVPVYRQPYYRARYGVQRLDGAEAYYARALSVPLHAGLNDADVDFVVETLADALGLGKRR